MSVGNLYSACVNISFKRIVVFFSTHSKTINSMNDCFEFIIKLFYNVMVLAIFTYFHSFTVVLDSIFWLQKSCISSPLEA